MRNISKENKQNLFLFMGDAGINNTNFLIENDVDVQTCFYLAAHHGSSLNGENDFNFLQKVNPQMIIFSHGIHQGHPSKATYLIAKNVTHAHQLVYKETSEPYIHYVNTGQKKKKKEALKHLKTRKNVVRPILSTLSTGSVHVYFDVGGEYILFTGKENFKHFLESVPKNENFKSKFSKTHQLICLHHDSKFTEAVQEEEAAIELSDKIIALIQEESEEDM